MPEAYGGPQIVELLEKTQKGDKVLFDDRQQPLTVTKGPTTPKGSKLKFISLAGPQGGEYDIVWGGMRGPYIPDMGPIHYFENQSGYGRDEGGFGDFGGLSL